MPATYPDTLLTKQALDQIKKSLADQAINAENIETISQAMHQHRAALINSIQACARVKQLNQYKILSILAASPAIIALLYKYSSRFNPLLGYSLFWYKGVLPLLYFKINPNFSKKDILPNTLSSFIYSLSLIFFTRTFENSLNQRTYLSQLMDKHLELVHLFNEWVDRINAAQAVLETNAAQGLATNPAKINLAIIEASLLDFLRPFKSKKPVEPSYSTISITEDRHSPTLQR